MSIDPSLALQTAIRAVLIASPEVTALVPAANVFDRSSRPERFPCVMLGEGQTVLNEIILQRLHVDASLDLHVWTQAGDLESVKLISGAIADALRNATLAVEAHRVIDFKLNSTRFLRDPGLLHAHAVMAIEATLEIQP